MSDIVTRAEKALEGVTGGPWDAAEAFDASFVCAGEGTVADSWIVRLDNRPGRVKDRADTRFIAAARTLVPELVAELKAARAQLERLEDLGCECGVRHACWCGLEATEVDNGFDHGWWCPTHGRCDGTYVYRTTEAEQ